MSGFQNVDVLYFSVLKMCFDHWEYMYIYGSWYKLWVVTMATSMKFGKTGYLWSILLQLLMNFLEFSKTKSHNYECLGEDEYSGIVCGMFLKINSMHYWEKMNDLKFSVFFSKIIFMNNVDVTSCNSINRCD